MGLSSGRDREADHKAELWKKCHVRTVELSYPMDITVLNVIKYQSEQSCFQQHTDGGNYTIPILNLFALTENELVT